VPEVPGGGTGSNILGIDEVVRYAMLAGFRGDALVTMVAIAKAESGFDANAAGDGALVNKTWGLSLGLWQVRSLNAEYGTGKTRDATKLRDPAFNARSAWAISGGGTNFKPWSVFTNGRYRQHLPAATVAVRVAGGGAGRGTGVTPGSTADGTAGTAGTSAVPGGLPVLSASTDASTQRPIPVRIGGRLAADELGQAVAGGSIDFSTTEVSQMTLVLTDKKLVLTERHELQTGTVLDNYGLRWQTMRFEILEGRGGEEARLICHPIGAVRLRSSVPSATQGISPTDYLAALARQAGLRFVGEPTAPRDIAPAEVEDTRGLVVVKRMQTAWEVGVEWGRRLGMLFFEAAGTLYFGRPDYLIGQGRRMQIGWRTFTYPEAAAGPVFPALEVPHCQGTAREFGQQRLSLQRQQDVIVKAKIDRIAGESLRPGMRVSLAGVPQFNNTGLLMSRVSWSLANVHEPVQIEARSAELVPAPDRTQEDTDASFGAPPVTSGPPGSRQPRISQADRVRYYGQPGDSTRYSTVRTPWGISVRVHPLVAARFLAACADANSSSRWRPRRIDSYANRNIARSNSRSLHSWALAWDIFSTPPGVPPPGGVQGKQSAPDDAFLFAFKRHGFYLGQEFKSNYDAPHVEWASAPPR
jgi:hypothetical protein